MTDITKLSYEIASGAQVSYDFDVAVNPSESGVAGRFAMRQILREYMLTVNPAKSRDMVHTIMSLNGGRRAVAIRDYADNYRLDNEVIPHTGTLALLGRTWLAPGAVQNDGDATTGSLSVFERILLPDATERPFVVKVNGAVPSPANYTFSDFGRITIPGLVDADTVTVTGDYLVAVCIVDAPSTTVITNSSGTTLHRFSDIRLRQIFEAELVKLTA